MIIEMRHGRCNGCGKDKKCVYLQDRVTCLFFRICLDCLPMVQKHIDMLPK